MNLVGTKWLFLLLLALATVAVVTCVWPGGILGLINGDTIAFEMAYVGLEDLDGPYRPRAFMPLSTGGEPNSPFYEALELQTKDVHPVHCPFFIQSKWAAVALQAGRPSVLYIDLDTDGSLSDSEILRGTLPPPNTLPQEYRVFHTPDFLARTEDGDDMPCRLQFIVRVAPDDSLECMMSPSYVLEGLARIAGQDVRLVLYTLELEDSITEYGVAQYSLSLTGGSSDKQTTRQALSRLVRWHDEFYRLQVIGRHEQGQTVKLLLRKDKRPSGGLKITLGGSQDVTSLAYASRVRDHSNLDMCLDTQLTPTETPFDLSHFVYSLVPVVERNTGYRDIGNGHKICPL